MSRCLPFPSLGYVRNGVSGEALSELIKGQARKRRKEREQGEICQKKPGHRERRKRLRSNEGGGRSEIQRKTEYGTQEMESSSLTEELKQPISDSFYESSDYSQSIRKKRNSRSRNECHNHGNIVQTDFQLQTHKTPEALSSKPDCSTLMMDSVVQKKLELPVEEQFSSASGVPATDVQELSNLTLVIKRGSLRGSHTEAACICKTSNASNDVLDHGYSTSCPYGQYLLHSPLMLDSGVQKKLELDPTPVKEQLSSDCGVPATDEKSEMAPTSSCSEISFLQIESQFRVSRELAPPFLAV
ncbi:hypothetical protein QUC31_015611 [Theobroma cacao]